MGTTTPAPAHLTLQCPACATWNRVDAARAAQRPKCGQCATAMALDAPWTLTEGSFPRTIAGSELPVLVDFHADWCGPCRIMSPVVDALASARVGRLLVAKLDTDAAQGIAQQYHIRGIPTVMVFVGGRAVATQSGAMGQRDLAAFVDRALAEGTRDQGPGTGSGDWQQHRD